MLLKLGSMKFLGVGVFLRPGHQRSKRPVPN